MRRGSERLAVGPTALLLAVWLVGCGGSASPSSLPTASGVVAGSPTGNGGSSASEGKLTVDVPGQGGSGPTLAPGVDWPAGVPADIPPFPGNVKMLMPQQTETERGVWIRIFCDGVSREQFTRYLAELRAGGYAIKGTVLYSGEDEKAEAERRAAEGDIDEVAASLGNRLLTITVPRSAADTVTFDIDGLTQAEADAITSGEPGAD